MSEHYYDSRSTTTSNWNYSGDTSNSSGWYYIYRPPRRILIKIPPHWSGDDLLDFVGLVNEETRVGFIIEMIVDGKVMIVDPNIETRTMGEFVPLLMWYASQSDKKKIQQFFERVKAQ